ncbi:Signal transduction histidine kinase [Nakamurella panacisegetis]|uniref:histidine kinase n=1 Tax=Nakamurella panacisegetis TaxID=1090615 RepID=A0A1H0LXL2_9ACTN|nr:histidine kinase [Nakamurella panacisegetis]SDO72813.1 Signal transduction histidine kinase [Nakamurella panacisegetis]
MRSSVYRWFERHVWAGDAIFGGLVFVVLVVNAAAYRSVDDAALLLLSVTAAPLFLRRSLPHLALLVSVVLLLANLAVIERPTFAVVLAPIAVHAAVVHGGSRVWGRAALTAGLLGSVLAPVRWGYATSGDAFIFLMAVGLCAVSVFAAFVIGERQRERAENQAQQLRTMAERAAMLASEKDQRARMAAATERTRIARELHDIVAHSLSVVIVQADGAAAAVVARPEVAADVLRTISETSREALAEMRRLVGVLRTSDSDGYAPVQGLSDVPALVEQVRQAGVPIDLRYSGPPARLSPGLELTVYRLIQEALTNVIKHAGPSASAVVEIGFGRGQLLVGVTDDGRGAAATRAEGSPERPLMPLVGGGRWSGGGLSDGGAESTAATRAEGSPERPLMPLVGGGRWSGGGLSDGGAESTAATRAEGSPERPLMPLVGGGRWSGGGLSDGGADSTAATRAEGSPERNGDGHGLLGMRERVALQGGALAVGPQVGGGFAVRARFPLPFEAVAGHWPAR